ncbi:MAG: hypothetical protein ACLUAM_08775 [Bifidobacterium adolescentis]
MILLIVDTNGENVEPQAFESKMDHQIDSIIHSSWAHRQVTPPEIYTQNQSGSGELLC